MQDTHWKHKRVVVTGGASFIGSHLVYRLVDLDAKVLDVIGWKPRKIVFDTSKPVAVATRALDITRAKTLLNWEPKISLEEGLQKTVNWHINTHKPKGYVDEKLLMERT